MIKRKGNVYKLDTPSTTLLIRAGTFAEYLYYGESLAVAGSDYDSLIRTNEGEDGALSLFSAFGGRDIRRFSVACTFADGSFSPRFVFQRAKFTEKPELAPLPSSYADSDRKSASQTLCLEFLDEPSRLRLFLYYTVFDDSDVIAVSSRLFNGGKREVRIKNLASLQLDLYGGGYSFVAFRNGRNGSRKFTSPLTEGAILSNEGTVGTDAAPFVMLEREDGAYAFNFIYSGAHKETAQQDAYPRTRVIMGINDFMLEKVLAAGESFSSPEATMTFARDEDGVFRAMRAFADRHIVRGKWKGRETPVIVGDGCGASFPPDRAELFASVKKSAELGAELFVVDESRFFRLGEADRDSDGGETDALAAFADYVRKAGMKFGVRLSPEALRADDEIFQKHPEFAMKIPGREPLRTEGRLLLNLADPRVRKYAIRRVSSVISQTKAAYIGWERGGLITDCFSRDVPAGEYFIRYTEGLYTVLAGLTEKFPSVLFGSGGRSDLGMLCFMPRTYADASEGAEIFPVCAYGFHGCSGNPFSFYFSVPSDAETETVKKRIAFYKKYRRLLQCGSLYSLGDSDFADLCGIICVSENKNSALAFVADGVSSISLKGLDASTVYEVKTQSGKSFSVSGELLMRGRLPYGSLSDDSETRMLFSGIRLLIVEKAKKGR